ncbi:MAG TPA: ABC transporter substrate-binding protein [Acidimicrobiales bacterium]|nr:ABC transporter substrate-binding protein [Acidimicrobiales bacterium]
MPRSLLLAPVLGVAVLVLAGCGDDAEPTADGDPTATTAPAAETGDDDTGADPADGDQADGVTTTTAAAAESGTRVVTDDRGTEVEVPASPERIVVGDVALLDAALALDLPVVGVPGLTDREAVPPYLAELAADVDELGVRDSFDLEAVAAARPDLLLVGTKGLEQLPDPGVLDAIAPVVALDSSTARPWRELLVAVADAAGVADRADELIAAWDADVAATADRLGDALATEVSVVRCFGPSCRYLPGGTSFSGAILDEIGVARPEPQRSDPEGRAFVEVSPERVDLLGGEVIVVFGTDAEASLAALRDNPLWESLSAVLAGEVYDVAPDPWFFGNVLAARVILDDVERILDRS